MQQQEEDFDELFRIHSGRVFAYAVRQSASREEAEDVVAETFLVCWRRWDELPENVLPWLLGTARKVMGNQRRASRRRNSLVQRLWRFTPREPADPSPEDVIEERAAMRTALRRLSEGDRELILLLAWEGLSHAEAAEVLGCSPGLIAVRAYRARARLLRHLSGLQDVRREQFEFLSKPNP